MHALIIGCGYLGWRAALRWVAAGHHVTTLTRSPDKAALMAQAGFHPIVGDVLDPAARAALPRADVLLIALTHDPSSRVPKRTLLVDGVANLARELRARVGHAVYVSSTSIYGQSDGSWVDEASPIEPTSAGGRLTLDAERAFQEMCDGPGSRCRATILRLAGIYGPGRLIARIDQLRSGALISGSPAAWLNLIHADDAARAVLATADSPPPSSTLLVCDDRPLPRGEFYGALAAAVGAPPPRFDPESSAGRRTSGLNKRCRNARMHAELGISLAYPDAAAALPGVMAATTGAATW